MVRLTGYLARRSIRRAIAAAGLAAMLSFGSLPAPAQSLPPAPRAGHRPADASSDPLAQPDKPRNTEKLKLWDSPYYRIYTDLGDDAAREAVMRMTRMAEEYHIRTKGFSGVIREKLPFYLFSTRDEYVKAGGRPDSAGVFTGRYLMAMCVPGRHGAASGYTWHIVQHEGFHQFANAVIGGELPPWVNEGLAEYFGEGIFTGDGFVTGLIPPTRLARLKFEISSHAIRTADEMLGFSPEEWNANLSMANYDKAWSMVHFLAHAEGGKYQPAFNGFMKELSRGRSARQAWQDNFGSAAGFEDHWQKFWTDLPKFATPELYARASVSSLTGFLGRAWTQNQTFPSFDAFLETDPKTLKMSAQDWLPISVFGDTVDRLHVLMRDDDFALSLLPPDGRDRRLPEILCTLKDGTRIRGAFELHHSGMQELIGPVSVNLTPPAPGSIPDASQKPTETFAPIPADRR